MVQYNFNTENNILYIDYSGKIIKKDIIELYENLLSEKNFPNHLLIFQNEMNAEFLDSENLIPIAVDSFKELCLKHDSIKVAVWQTEPVKTAYSFVFKKTVNLKNFFVEIFYTKNVALDWLNNIQM